MDHRHTENAPATEKIDVPHPATNASPPRAGRRVDTSDQVEDAADREIGGRNGPEPTRFGDWEKNGRCIDF